MVFAEDHSRVRTANGPQVMASLRNLVIGLLRLGDRPAAAGREGNIAAGLRSTGWDHPRGFALLGS